MLLRAIGCFVFPGCFPVLSRASPYIDVAELIKTHLWFVTTLLLFPLAQGVNERENPRNQDIKLYLQEEKNVSAPRSLR